MVALTVGTNINASALIRRREIALQRILGMRTGDLVMVHVGAALLIVAIGAVIGFFLAQLVIDQARAMMAADQSLRRVKGLFAPIAPLFPYIFSGALVIAFLAAFFPARSAARTDPARVLKSE